MAGAFQSSAFQSTAFQTGAVVSSNSGITRLRSADYYRDVQRKTELQVQQIRLAELQQQQRELEAKRLADEALRKAAQDQKPRKPQPAPDTAADDKISALVRELADLSGAVETTRAEIVRLEAAEAQALAYEAMRMEDDDILFLAASI